MALSGAMEAGRLDRTARVRALFVVPAFAACYVPLIIAGYALKEDFSSLTIIWPAAGVLLATLFFSPLRLWPALLITALACELAVGFAHAQADIRSVLYHEAGGARHGAMGCQWFTAS